MDLDIVIPRLGIDVGRVIIDGSNNDNTDTSFFGGNYLATTAVAGAFEAIRQLVQYFGADNTFIVSKCYPPIQEQTRKWLAHHEFYERTGVKPENVHFCLKRHQKAPICEELEITHFIDDKLEVLSYLDTVATRYLFQSQPREVEKYKEFLPKVTQVGSWAEILQAELAGQPA